MTARHGPTPWERLAEDGGPPQRRATRRGPDRGGLPAWAAAILVALAAGVGYTTGLHEERARHAPRVTSAECGLAKEVTNEKKPPRRQPATRHAKPDTRPTMAPATQEARP